MTIREISSLMACNKSGIMVVSMGDRKGGEKGKGRAKGVGEWGREKGGERDGWEDDNLRVEGRNERIRRMGKAAKGIEEKGNEEIGREE